MKKKTYSNICMIFWFLLVCWNVEKMTCAKKKGNHVLATHSLNKLTVRRQRYVLFNVKLNSNNVNQERSKHIISINKSVNKEKLNKIKKIENVINKYNLKIFKLEVKDLEIQTRQLMQRKIEWVKQQINEILKIIEQVKIFLLNMKHIKWETYNIYYIEFLKNLKKKIVFCTQELNKTFYISHLLKNNFNNFLFKNNISLSKIGNYGCVNLFFLLFALAYFGTNPFYNFLKKNYAFIGEFKNIKTEQFIKIYTISTFLFFFYKFSIIRLIYIFNSFNVSSKSIYHLNSIIHFLFYCYLFLSPYFLIRSNWGTFYVFNADTSKFLGRLFLTQLLLIISRLMCMNVEKDFTYITKWKDEEYFNKKDFLKNLKNDQKMEFYIDLLNRFPFLKKIYIGKNKFFEVLLYLHKYKHVLDFVLPVNNLFYIYIAHSLFLHLNNLSYAGIYLSFLSFIFLFFHIFTKKIDTYYLKKTR